MFVYKFYVGVPDHIGYVDTTNKVDAALYNNGIEGATIYFTDGLWRGQQEKSLVLEIIAHNGNLLPADIHDIRADLRIAFEQEYIMVTQHEAIQIT